MKAVYNDLCFILLKTFLKIVLEITISFCIISADIPLNIAYYDIAYYEVRMEQLQAVLRFKAV